MPPIHRGSILKADQLSTCQAARDYPLLHHAARTLDRIPPGRELPALAAIRQAADPSRYRSLCPSIFRSNLRQARALALDTSSACRRSVAPHRIERSIHPGLPAQTLPKCAQACVQSPPVPGDRPAVAGFMTLQASPLRTAAKRNNGWKLRRIPEVGWAGHATTRDRSLNAERSPEG